MTTIPDQAAAGVTSENWICPNCGQPLQPAEDRSLACAGGHHFDLAREGYVNLLTANRRGSREPGDNREMIAARRRIHEAQLYQPLATAIQERLRQLDSIGSVLDLGCGEGYYTAAIADALPAARVFGVDISRAGVRLAAKRCKSANFAVASAVAIPLGEGAIDLLASVFAPIDNQELLRLLPVGGHYLKVTPAAQHLWELRCALYEQPRPHVEERPPPPGFELVSATELRYRLQVPAAQLADLVAMTPFAYRGQRDKRAALLQLPALAAQMHFTVALSRRIAIANVDTADSAAT